MFNWFKKYKSYREIRKIETTPEFRFLSSLDWDQGETYTVRDSTIYHNGVYATKYTARYKNSSLILTNYFNLHGRIRGYEVSLHEGSCPKCQEKIPYPQDVLDRFMGCLTEKELEKQKREEAKKRLEDEERITEIVIAFNKRMGIK